MRRSKGARVGDIAVKAIDDLPAILQRDVSLAFDHLLEACNDQQRDRYQVLLNDSRWASRLTRLFAASQFCAQQARRHPDWLPDLHDSGDLDRTLPPDDWHRRLHEFAGDPASVDALDKMLRDFRNREYLRILWRDFNRLCELPETTADITGVAESCIQAALEFHDAALRAELGTPTSAADGSRQQLVILGMGKLGARELNLSSDIDLIFSYPAQGETQGATQSATQGAVRSVHNQEYFSTLGKRVIQSLDRLTPDGFVFRVDMRLRPYGDSGALVLNFDAMEEYYQDQGRDWERYAMIKARVVAGDQQAGARLLEILRPFTYRRYLDFSAFESLREMKRLIQREVRKRKLNDNIKLGPGGIREIEFIAQCFQLIRGGRERVLQQRNLRNVLKTLRELQYLPSEVVDELQAANIFLRNTEHAIQGYADKQTQDLPTSEPARAAIALAMDFSDWTAFKAELDRHRDRVGIHFGNIIEPVESEKEGASEVPWAPWQLFWSELDANTDAAQTLTAAGHEDAPEVARRLLALRNSSDVRRMQSTSRERLDAFMPRLLLVVLGAEKPSQTLLRILPLVESVLRRTAYLVLAVENPQVLQQLVVLCAASPWIAQQLSRHPVLLDELLNAGTLYTAPEKSVLQRDLQAQLLRVPMDDLEAQMEALRYFKLAHALRVAASEVTGRLPLMKVSDYLTWIAEAILAHVLELAWHFLVEKHGRPQKAEGVACDKDFIIVGYGKLGGIELGHNSDLDLVFIHDADPMLMTDGIAPIDNGGFFTRLGQRIIHILTAQTAMGMLYEVDMRLRPSGNSGLLVTSLKAFRDYQLKEAWTWEHQALVRARPVAGDAALAEKFNAVRKEIICLPRDPEKLKHDVVEMREKMRAQLTPKDTETEANPVFDLKHGRGAIVDIEFIVQYSLLRWAHEHPELARWTDNVRQLEILQSEQLLREENAERLTAAYKSYRDSLHRLNLQQEPGRAELDAFSLQRELVVTTWAEMFFPMLAPKCGTDTNIQGF
jgi:glutamate-ammonia-ligase adenylyltransferase